MTRRLHVTFTHQAGTDGDDAHGGMWRITSGCDQVSWMSHDETHQI